MSNAPPLSFIHAPPSDFPTDILKWMKENAAPKMALKLMKCCKYFQHFLEFPFFVVKEVEYGVKRDNWYFVSIDDEKHFYEGTQGLENIGKKLWITETVALSEFPNLVSIIIPKIAVCDIQYLVLDNQILSFDEFKFLTSSGNVNVISLHNTRISNKNGKLVSIFDILQCAPNLQEFICDDMEISLSLAEIDINYHDMSKLEHICFNINSYEYFKMLIDFMNRFPHIKYQLNFAPHLLSAEETQSVEKHIQQIIDAGVTQNPPPIIFFVGQNIEKAAALRRFSIEYNKQKLDEKIKLMISLINL